MSLTAYTCTTARPLTKSHNTNPLFSFSSNKHKKKSVISKPITNKLPDNKCISCPLHVDDEDSLNQMLTCATNDSINIYSHNRLHLLSFELENTVNHNNESIDAWIDQDLKELDNSYYAFVFKAAYYDIILKVMVALQTKKTIIICPNPILPKKSIIKLCKFLSEKSITLGAPNQFIWWIDDPNPVVMSALNSYDKKSDVIIHCV